MQLDIGRSVTYPLDDSGWFRKLIVLFIIGFVPGLNLIAWSGYALSVARNLGRADDTPLPEWSNWVEITLRGFLSLGATALYMLPVMLGLVALSGDSGLSRIIGTLAVIVYFLSANYLLTIGHLRYAQTDQPITILRFSDAWMTHDVKRAYLAYYMAIRCWCRSC